MQLIENLTGRLHSGLHQPAKTSRWNKTKATSSETQTQLASQHIPLSQPPTPCPHNGQTSILAAIDIMACSNTFENLLRFSRSIPSVFRFDVEMIGDTVFLIRKENSPTELIKHVKGYGHTFPTAYTKWDDGLEKSTSH